MEYETLALIPALGIFFIILATAYVKLFFRRKLPLQEGSFSSSKALNFHGLKPNKATRQAQYFRNRSFFVFLAVFATFIWISWQIWTIDDPMVNAFKPFYILFGGYALFQYFIASFVKPYKINTKRINLRESLPAAIIVPVYNEDSEGLKAGLRSLLTQTVLPKEIHVVDDGSNVDYKKTKAWLQRSGKKANVRVTWTRQENSGKRAAQIMGYSKTDKNAVEIIITVDSDGELDPRAIEEGLKPFATDEAIQSVAGVVVAKNAQDNFLARVTDLIFVSGQQLIDRASMSAFNSVIVNSGGLALYRKEVLEHAINNDYDEEYFLNRKVSFSDDSFLTLMALQLGKTVHQPTAIVFSDMPVKMSHHIRQQLRWSRGSFIRGLWRVHYLPMTSPGSIRQVLGWAIFMSITIVQLSLFVIIPLFYSSFPSPYLLLIPVLFAFLISSRYFSIARSDMTIWSQIYTYLHAPLAVIWSALVLRSIRVYAIFTCAKTGWGTRQKVEIVYDKKDPEAVS